MPADVLGGPTHSPEQTGYDGQSSLVTNGPFVHLTWWGQLIIGNCIFCIYAAKSSLDLPQQGGRGRASEEFTCLLACLVANSSDKQECGSVGEKLKNEKKSK